MVILASNSPRRADLLASACIEFKVESSSIDESVIEREDPFTYSNRLAIKKGIDVGAKNPDDIVISADTVVSIFVNNWIILGKPQSQEEAYYFLDLLSGRDHLVVTSVAVRKGELVYSMSVPSYVKFRKLSNKEMQNYIDTGDCYDKAGGYGIQGKALSFVSYVRGSLTGVIGLPVEETLELINKVDGAFKI